MLEALNAPLDDAFRELDALTRVNRAAADAVVARVTHLQRSATQLLAVLAVFGALLTLAIGVLAMRAMRRWDAVQRGYTDALTETNRNLEAFAGRVAHDLKGPLTTATLTTSRLARSAPGQDAAIAMLRRSIARMQALIDDLLELARMQATSQPAECDPAAVVAQVREDLAAREGEADVEIVTQVEPATVRCREGLLRQAVWNLAENAIKYRRAEERAHVEVSGHAAEAVYELSVRDNGVGMSPDDARQAFDPFYRAARTKEAPGLGLGLSIVKRVVEASGGAMSVDSELGRGSTFVMRLPLA
jgi:signal transduction histidine kinase